MKTRALSLYRKYWKYQSCQKRNLAVWGFLLLCLLLAQAYSSNGITTGGINPDSSGEISCYRPYIIDGDTFDCSGQRIRLANIDAPEMPDHCRTGRKCTEGNPFKSKAYLKSLTRATVLCHKIDTDQYGRTVANCTVGDKDLSCEMVASGNAVERYGSLSCNF